MEGQNPFEGITECVSHISHADTDCEWCQQELEAKALAQQGLADQAGQRLMKINSLGATIPEAALVLERLDTLIDSIIHDPRQRVHFEASYNARVINRLIDAEKAVRSAMITQGVSPDGGLITPKKRGRP
jgi:hypothetical protein